MYSICYQYDVLIRFASHGDSTFNAAGPRQRFCLRTGYFVIVPQLPGLAAGRGFPQWAVPHWPFRPDSNSGGLALVREAIALTSHLARFLAALESSD